jgi:integral membrane protein (TIGR01906 family)
VPFALAGNALMLLAWGWLPRALYVLPGFPGGDGLEGGERLALAQTGVDSIQPWDADGIDSLREATLPTGMPAFAAREIAHMQDVRDLMSALVLAWAIALAALIAAWLATRGRAGARAALRAGLRAGAVAAIALLAALGVFMLADFDAFFTAFHGLFFEGDSWRFATDDTLRRLYPDAFWGISGGVLAGLTIAQALALARAARPPAATA